MEQINGLQWLRMSKKQKLNTLKKAYNKAKNQAEMIEIIKYIERVKAAA